MKVILLYLPVPHRGYKEFFARHSDVDVVFILGDELIGEFKHLRKNLPALSPEEIRSSLTAMHWLNAPLEIANRLTLEILNNAGSTVVMPREDVGLALVEKYLPHCTIEFDHRSLRWDKERALAKVDVIPDCEISEEQFDIDVMGFLENQKSSSMDFWRQVSAAIVRNGRILTFAHNVHVPDEESPYFFGDPRFNFSRGISVELSTAEHAETQLVAWCARYGEKMEGASLYTLDFPCPPCAKTLKRTGIAACYFRNGYSMVDSELILRSEGIRIIRVK